MPLAVSALANERSRPLDPLNGSMLSQPARPAVKLRRLGDRARALHALLLKAITDHHHPLPGPLSAGPVHAVAVERLRAQGAPDAPGPGEAMTARTLSKRNGIHAYDLHGNEHNSQLRLHPWPRQPGAAVHHTAIWESARGSVPPHSTPLRGSRRMIWPRP